MHISQKGLNLIKNFEGCRLCAYKDPVGILTIGYGHTGSDVKPGLVITQEYAERLLKQDLEKFETQVKQIVEINLNQNQFDALVSFTYNCGANNLKTLTNGRSTDVIAQKILLYNKSNGKVLAGLTKRRIAESELFSSLN